MSFQLVRAGDDEIVVWHVDHGHIFSFEIAPRATALIPGPVWDGPDAAEPSKTFRDAALHFATEEALSRKLIGAPRASAVRAMRSCSAAL